MNIFAALRGKVRGKAAGKATEEEKQLVREELARQGYGSSGERTSSAVRQATGNELPDSDAMKRYKERKRALSGK